jgi:ketosteroid isomerase-like protein
MITEAEKQAAANGFLIGLKTRDWDLMKSIMTEDVVWSLPGNSLISGEARGVDAVVNRAKLIVSYGLNFAFQHIMYGYYGVALSLNNTAKRGDLILDEQVAIMFVIRDGKISAINTHLSDVEMANAFFV